MGLSPGYLPFPMATATITPTTTMAMMTSRIAVTDTTPYRGQAITVTVISAETLSKLPRITVTQPGISAWAVTMSHVSGRTYKVTLRLKSSSTGTLTLRASGYDAASAYGSSSVALAGTTTTGRVENTTNELRFGFKYRF